MNKGAIYTVLVIVAFFTLRFIQYSPALATDLQLVSSDEETFKEFNADLDVNNEYLRKLHKNILQNKSSGVNSVLIKKDGVLIYEQYYETKKWVEGEEPKYTKQYIDSITKSILSALVGIAIEKGYFEKGLEETPIALFDDYAFEDKYPKSFISLENLLMMKSGFYWVELTPHIDRKAMWEYYSPLTYALNANMTFPAGRYFNFNSGLSVIIGKAIEEKSGMDLYTFAKKYLFDPLEINPYWYQHEESGDYLGSDGIFMTSDDLMKFLELYRNYGEYNGQSIIGREWVEESTKEHTNTTEYPKRYEGYGYHWWIPKFKSEAMPLESYGAYGAEGQRAIVFKDKNLSIVITGRLKRPEYVYSLIAQYILPSVGYRDVVYEI